MGYCAGCSFKCMASDCECTCHCKSERKAKKRDEGFYKKKGWKKVRMVKQ